MAYVQEIKTISLLIWRLLLDSNSIVKNYKKLRHTVNMTVRFQRQLLPIQCYPLKYSLSQLSNAVIIDYLTET